MSATDVGKLLALVHLEDASPAVVVAYVAVVLTLAASIVWLALSTLFRRKDLPPVFPTLPVIGGFLKFIQVGRPGPALPCLWGRFCHPPAGRRGGAAHAALPRRDPHRRDFSHQPTFKRRHPRFGPGNTKAGKPGRVIL